ncbi:hypothetical protein SRB5_25790 [Streptomyces sp. RB5]|uniref:Uncharacterized protein n=1 Tax=Streptomyces smaragdinus TaxID=2585196 RepID=A0A7K0CG41_9ACTN|nr:hypothetical protein [Streptomyces smaragdinus]MQY12445.1 hypothetical protein [Streptomyces smaragdinus]
MSLIDDLWAANRLPDWDALYFSGDENGYGVDLDPSVPGGMRVLKSFDLHKAVADHPESLSGVGSGLAVMPLEGGDELWGGEGAHGSNGHVVRVRADESLVWMIFFWDSNPFSEPIELSGRYATFRSTTDVVITVDIDDPRRPVPDQYGR